MHFIFKVAFAYDTFLPHNVEMKIKKKVFRANRWERFGNLAGK